MTAPMAAAGVPLSVDEPVWSVDGWEAGVTDVNGISWYVEKVAGWRENPGPRLVLDDRPDADGAWDSPSVKSSRVITLTGVAECYDLASLETASDRFTAVLADGRTLKTLVVSERTRTRQCQVRLSQAAPADPIGRWGFRWQLQMIAPDPLKYDAIESTESTGLPQSSPVGLTVPFTVPFTIAEPVGSTGMLIATNAGTYPTEPIITITGPVSNPNIEHTDSGRQLRMIIDLAASDTLVIDVRNKVILLGGTAPRDCLAFGSAWFSLEPGPNAIRYNAQAYNAASTMTVTWRSAWM